MKKYDIIYADPAWSFGDRLRSSKKKDNGIYDPLEEFGKYILEKVRNNRKVAY